VVAKLKQRQILVTGGAGFIGSHLAAALAARGDQVRVLDNLSSGKRENLQGTPAELIVGDIRDPETVRRAVDGCDLIFHQAALVSVPRSLAEPALNHAVNVEGTFHVFEAARRAGVKRVVYASSSAVYGDLLSLPARETDSLSPISPYAVAKETNEREAAVYNRVYDTEFIGLRYFNVFGPRQDPSSPYSGVLSIFCRAAVAGDGVTIYGDGEQTRDFVYVADVVAANLAAAALQWVGGETAVFNIGRGEQTNLLQIVDALRRLSGGPAPITFAPPRPGDIRHSVAAVDRARRHLDYQPSVSVEAGLEQTLAWFTGENLSAVTQETK
jgi:UDP-glucose 4-epimerase